MFNLFPLAVSLWGFRAIPRLPLPKFPSKAKKLFGISESEIRSLSKLRAKIEPKHFLSKSSLRGKDATLGFKMGKKQAGKYMCIMKIFYHIQLSQIIV